MLGVDGADLSLIVDGWVRSLLGGGHTTSRPTTVNAAEQLYACAPSQLVATN